MVGRRVGKVTKVIAANNATVIANVEFTIPPWLKSGTVHFRVISKAGASFNKHLSVNVRFPKDRIFIQTDKPIYKPGSKGSFNLFSLWQKCASQTLALLYLSIYLR